MSGLPAYLGGTEPTLTGDTGTGTVSTLSITAAPNPLPFLGLLLLQDTITDDVQVVTAYSPVNVGDTTVSIIPVTFSHDFTVADTTVQGFVNPYCGQMGFTFRGLAFGTLLDPTLALVQSMTYGLAMQSISVKGFDQPAIASGDLQRDLDTGEFLGVDLEGGRDIIVQMSIASNNASDLEFLRSYLGQAMTPDPAGSTEYPLQFSTDFSGNVYAVNVRPRRFNFTIDINPVLAFGLIVTLQFHATDPRVYAAPTQRLSLTSTGTSVTGFANNVGTKEMRPLLTLTASGAPAPITIRNLSLSGGPALIFTTPLASGDQIIVDMDFHTAWYVPASGPPFDCLYQLDASSEWWNLPVGDNEIELDSVGGDTTLDMDWASAYGAV